MNSEAVTHDPKPASDSATGSHTMQILLLAALFIAVIAVAKLLATPVQQQGKLVPIRIRNDEETRRRR